MCMCIYSLGNLVTLEDNRSIAYLPTCIHHIIQNLNRPLTDCPDFLNRLSFYYTPTRYNACPNLFYLQLQITNRESITPCKFRILKSNLKLIHKHLTKYPLIVI